MESATEFTIPQSYQSNTSSPLRWILSHLKHQWWIIIIALIGATGNAVLASVAPMYIGNALNVIREPDPNLIQLRNIALIIFGSQVIRSLMMLSRNFGFEIIAQRMERNTRNELYVSLLGKNMTFHSLQSVGDIMARATNDVREVNMMFTPGLSLVIGSLNFLIMPLILAPRYHPQLVITPAIFLVVYFIALWRYLKKLRPMSTEVRASFGVMNQRLSEALDGVEIVKGAAKEEEELSLFSRNIMRYRDAEINQGFMEARFIPPLLLDITIALGLLHAVFLFRNGLLDLGQITAYTGILGMLGFPTFASRFAYSRISLGLAGARRILELINTENNLDQNLAGYNHDMLGEVEFRNVCFRYQGSDINSLEGISFKVHPGQTIAIVGQTGYGKTSLVRLINRTYDANKGQVIVDGVDVKDWNLEALRKNISIIEQDVFLFSRSIAENISFGKPGASTEEIIEAAKAAQAHEFIMEFNEGYETVVGERGTTLSGGQRQRIALARAFLTDPKILILDDSTSAIDSATEDKIQRAIFHAAEGRTTFIITHRLSQIRWADLILVLKKGQLVSVGSHDDLMKTSQAYRNIFSE